MAPLCLWSQESCRAFLTPKDAVALGTHVARVVLGSGPSLTSFTSEISAGLRHGCLSFLTCMMRKQYLSLQRANDKRVVSSF